MVMENQKNLQMATKL